MGDSSICGGSGRGGKECWTDYNQGNAYFGKWYVICDNGRTGTTTDLFPVYYSDTVSAHCIDNRYNYRVGGATSRICGYDNQGGKECWN